MVRDLAAKLQTMKIASIVKVYRKSAGDDEWYMVVDFKTGPQIVHITPFEWKKLAIRCRDEGVVAEVEGSTLDEQRTIYRLF
jgi:hypothetical protein